MTNCPLDRIKQLQIVGGTSASVMIDFCANENLNKGGEIARRNFCYITIWRNDERVQIFTPGEINCAIMRQARPWREVPFLGYLLFVLKKSSPCQGRFRIYLLLACKNKNRPSSNDARCGWLVGNYHRQLLCVIVSIKFEIMIAIT